MLTAANGFPSISQSGGYARIEDSGIPIVQNLHIYKVDKLYKILLNIQGYILPGLIHPLVVYLIPSRIRSTRLRGFIPVKYLNVHPEILGCDSRS